jgi:hypothetical protein
MPSPNQSFFFDCKFCGERECRSQFGTGNDLLQLYVFLRYVPCRNCHMPVLAELDEDIGPAAHGPEEDD